MISGYVHTLGDATLDNRFWISKSITPAQRTVEEALQDRVQAAGLKVMSHAYDGFTTRSILEGSLVGAALPPGSAKAAYMREKTLHGAFVHPLLELKKAVDANPNTPHYVVISVGDNDFRENLANTCHLWHNTAQTQKRYLQIVDTIQGWGNKNVHPILVLQYRPDANQDPYKVYHTTGRIGTVAALIYTVCFGLLNVAFILLVLPTHLSVVVPVCLFALGTAGTYFTNRTISLLAVTDECLETHRCGMVVLGELIKSFYRPMLEYANQKNIPILDLTNTFNPYEKLYKCGVVPNHNGGQLIAEGVHHVVTTHDFTNGYSALYSKNNMLTKRYNVRPFDAYCKQPNHPPTWRVHPPTRC